MKYIIGLGNPGNEYKETRHNAGFIFIDSLIEHHFLGDSSWEYEKMLLAYVYKTQNITFVKPDTFMNESGKTISLLFRNKKNIDISDLLVVYDDIDFTTGDYKIVVGKGTSNHNGAKSVDAALGTKDYARMRIGIGHPPAHLSVSHYVLAKFADSELKLIKKLGENDELIK